MMSEWVERVIFHTRELFFELDRDLHFNRWASNAESLVLPVVHCRLLPSPMVDDNGDGVVSGLGWPVALAVVLCCYASYARRRCTRASRQTRWGADDQLLAARAARAATASGGAAAMVEPGSGGYGTLAVSSSRLTDREPQG